MFKDVETLFLFDVDGTLTKSRSLITNDMKNMLVKIRKSVMTAFVGGSDLPKQQEQLGSDCLDLFDLCFPENGVSFYKNGKLVAHQKIIGVLGESLYKEFVNFCLDYFSKLDIPIKRGTFIEYRNSMINISPIGRNCSKEERKEFNEYDKIHKIREKMVEKLKEKFAVHDLQFSIGGEISIDCFPVGWDKTHCLDYIEKEGIKKIYFFGDMTHEGGNDYEIFEDNRTIGINVKNPEETMIKVKEILNLK